MAIGTGQPGVYELGNIFGGVLLTGFSREFELEADEVGARYMAKAGYSPDAMLNTIEILKAKDRIEIEQARLEKRKPAVYHGFLSSHPDNDTRYKQAIKESSKLLQDFDEFIKTDEFMEKLNGLAYGSAGRLELSGKTSFTIRNLVSSCHSPGVGAMNPQEKAFSLYLRLQMQFFLLARIVSIRELLRRILPKTSWDTKYVMEKKSQLVGMPAYLGIADRADSPFGPRPVRFAVLFDPRKRLAYILQGAGKHDLRKIANDRDFIATIFSFGRMTRDDFKIAKVPKVQIVRAEEDTTMEDLAASSPITNYALDKLRVINGLYPEGQPEPGQLIKIID